MDFLNFHKRGKEAVGAVVVRGEPVLVCRECNTPVAKAGFQIQNRRGDKKQLYACPQCRRRTVNPAEARG